jgi:hypothetical protein
VNCPKCKTTTEIIKVCAACDEPDAHVFGNPDALSLWANMKLTALSRDSKDYDNSISCGNCGEPLTFAHGVGACLEGCDELHGYDQESDLWTPAILEDRRKT